MTATTDTQHLELPITGMTCASCANRIERKLNKLDGVSASVNYATERATVDYDPAAVAPEQLTAAVEAAGYQAALPDGDAPSNTEATDETAPLRQRLLISAALTLPVFVATSRKVSRPSSRKSLTTATRTSSGEPAAGISAVCPAVYGFQTLPS